MSMTGPLFETTRFTIRVIENIIRVGVNNLIIKQYLGNNSSDG